MPAGALYRAPITIVLPEIATAPPKRSPVPPSSSAVSVVCSFQTPLERTKTRATPAETLPDGSASARRPPPCRRRSPPRSHSCRRPPVGGRQLYLRKSAGSRARRSPGRPGTRRSPKPPGSQERWRVRRRPQARRPRRPPREPRRDASGGCWADSGASMTPPIRPLPATASVRHDAFVGREHS